MELEPLSHLPEILYALATALIRSGRRCLMQKRIPFSKGVVFAFFFAKK
jgi:hypothetical protein